MRKYLIVTAFLLSAAPLAAAPSGQLFDSAEKAAEALAQAARTGDTSAVLAVLGPDAKDIIVSGDPVADAQARKRFIEAFDAKHNIEMTGDDRALLDVGEDAAPFPVPIVKVGSAWAFDSALGAEEILARRIGINELEAIESLKAYVQAQETYAQAGVAGPGGEYAQRLISSPGKKDGLFWPAKADEDESPLGPLIGGARSEGYVMAAGSPVPFHGYVFRILKRQGNYAPGGALDYVIGGRMIGGFAMIASPASYGTSGVMSFMVGSDGVVLQKDLGPETARVAAGITEYNPDPSWIKAEP